MNLAEQLKEIAKAIAAEEIEKNPDDREAILKRLAAYQPIRKPPADTSL